MEQTQIPTLTPTKVSSFCQRQKEETIGGCHMHKLIARWNCGMRRKNCNVYPLQASIAWFAFCCHSLKNNTRHLAGVLHEASTLLTPVDFLNLLPQDGNVPFFLPFIEKSYRHYQTIQLKETIISKGEQLSHSV